ncbi:MAG: hypothetical protein J6O39_04135 [Treponema sp.]|nr:hypothetical protein [Treponema sp.]
MKTNRIKVALFVAFITAGLTLAGCSRMIYDLRIFMLNIVSSEMSNPGSTVTIKVTDDIPSGSVPVITYTLPDGTTVTVEGTVTDNGDGTRTLEFDLNPVPQGLPGGRLPVTVTVPDYAPTPATVTYTPPVETSVVSGSKEYKDEDDDGVIDDDIEVPSNGGTIEKPKVKTNYREEDIIIEETYTDESDNPIPDENGDGVVDWKDVEMWLTKDEDDDGVPDNAEKKVKVKIKSTPEDDTDPSSAEEMTCFIKSGSALKVSITVSTTVFTLSSVAEGSSVTFTVATTLESPAFTWYVDGSVQTGETAATFILDTSTLESGVHTVTVTCVKDGVPYSAEATVTK